MQAAKESKKAPEKMLYVVETKEEVFASERKLDAIYKHVEFSYGTAKYREIPVSKFSTTKPLVRL